MAWLDDTPVASLISGPEFRTPGAQLRFTDVDGHRFTAFATDKRKGQLADLELRRLPDGRAGTHDPAP